MKILTALITETTEILEKDKLQLLKMDMDGATAAVPRQHHGCPTGVP